VAVARREGTRAAPIRPHAILGLVLLATALSNLEVGLVTVALPTLAATFGGGPTTIQWVAISYQLAIIGTLILFGRLVDLFGGRTLYLAGMATVAAASLLALLSQNALWLILARGLLGLGAAMLLATGQALLAVAYPHAGRGRALGYLHMAVAAGLMAGSSRRSAGGRSSWPRSCWPSGRCGGRGRRCRSRTARAASGSTWRAPRSSSSRPSSPLSG